MKTSIFKFQILSILFPLFSLVGFGLFLIFPFKIYLKEVINLFLVITILISIVFLLKNPVLRKVLLFFSVILLHILVFIKLSFYYNYNARLNASALFIIFETNKLEASSFLSSYFSGFIVCLILFFTASLIFFFNFFWRYDLNRIEEFFKGFYINKTPFLIIIILVSAVVIKYKFESQNLFLTSINAYKDYSKVKKRIKEDLSQTQSKFVNVSSKVQDFETHVVIIGESTSRWHMQLYGYNRETTPYLEALRNELYIFTDVISPRAHTVESLDRILTFSDYNSPFKKQNASLVQLANQAGYETYWLSNQQAIGLNETVSTQIGYAANNKFFMSPDDYIYISYDGILLDKLNDVLKDRKSKIIFVHLMGTHEPYELRYPENYNYFESDNESRLVFSTSKEEIIDQYDNANRYNDYIVGSIINSVKKLNIKSTVTYFSDHGDDVYDTNNQTFLRHSEYAATKPMFDVPFIIWVSDLIRLDDHNNLSQSFVNRKYNLEDYIHTFSDLFHITHDKFNREKSIINENFKEKNRFIGDGIDYDSQK